MKCSELLKAPKKQPVQRQPEPKAKPQPPPVEVPRDPADAPLIKLYEQLKEKDGYIDVGKFIQKLWENGILVSDYPSLKDVQVTVFTDDNCAGPLKMNLQMFLKAARPVKDVLLKTFGGQLIIPDFPKFSRTLYLISEAIKLDKRGAVPHSPEHVDRGLDIWAVSVCSIDGQRWNYGDSSYPFTLQGCCTPLLYGLALELSSTERIKHYVSHEPATVGMTPFSLDEFGRTLNPLTKTGAITISTLIQRIALPQSSQAERFKYALAFVKELTGGADISFNNSVFLNDQEGMSINKSLKCYLQSLSTLPAGADLDEALNFYQQASSVQVNSKSLCVIAATLANVGVNPLTKNKLLSETSIKHVLSSMYTCGAYNDSSVYAVEVGIPSKAGMNGVIMGVVPGLFGIALYSPKVNKHHISVRAYNYMKTLSEAFYFHKFETPILKGIATPVIDDKQCTYNCYLFRYVAEGDLIRLIRLLEQGVDVWSVDLMNRTILHAAVQHKQIEMIVFLCAIFPKLLDAKDNMGQTPYDDALYFNRQDVKETITIWQTIHKGAGADPPLKK